MSLSSEIKAEALRVGFDTVGIASVHRLDDEAAKLREWLARGYHASMGYMARNVEKREDITRVFPGARSVIVGTVNYYTPFAPSTDPATAKISRYAWGDDYHDVIPPKLDALLAFVQARVPGATGKYYVDTGPVLEKAWAVHAGIGWLGKHTNVIAPAKGSWFFLAVLIVDVDLEPDAPVQDHCGTCTACIDACPTQAIVEPYVLDASRCISYLTIELKAKHEIPADLATRLDGWVFGCDVCQDVCPWNSFQQPTQDARFLPRPGAIGASFEELTHLTQEAFDARFEGSPVMRTGREGLRRNAAAHDHAG